MAPFLKLQGLWVFASVLLCALCVPPPTRALAQQAPTHDSATARSLFVQGAKAAKEGDWVRARDAFAASYALHESPRTLFNLGIARGELGEIVAACEALRVFLRDADPEREADNIAVARRELLRMEPKIAYVRVEALDVSENDRLEVDGRMLPSGVLGTELPLDPGAHHFRLVRPESVAAERHLEIGAGEHTTIKLAPETPPVISSPAPVLAQTAPDQKVARAPALATSSLPDRRDESRTRRRFWIGASVALAVSGAALATFLIMREDDAGLTEVDSNVHDGGLRIP